MYSRQEKEIQKRKLIAGGRFSSFGFAEALALRVGAKPNVLNVCWLCIYFILSNDFRYSSIVVNPGGI